MLCTEKLWFPLYFTDFLQKFHRQRPNTYEVYEYLGLPTKPKEFAPAYHVLLHLLHIKDILLTQVLNDRHGW